jgi:hypothetical protein
MITLPRIGEDDNVYIVDVLLNFLQDVAYMGVLLRKVIYNRISYNNINDEPWICFVPGNVVHIYYT